MRKAKALLVACLILVSSMGASAAAASGEAPLPQEVLQSVDKLEIKKVYVLDPEVDPEALPRDTFERDGYLYECVDILRTVVMGEVCEYASEEIQIESTKNDLETVLGLLPSELEVGTARGYAGRIPLDVSAIKSEVSGYGSTATPYTVTRSYPNLSDADAQFIPKAIEDGGRTLTFSSVQWVPDWNNNPDDTEIGDRYTAVATYTGTKISNYVKGYIITASYRGEVVKSESTAIRYTVVFAGTPILETTESIPLRVWIAWIALIVLAGLALVLVIKLFRPRRKHHERKNIRRMRSAYHSDDDTGGSD